MSLLEMWGVTHFFGGLRAVREFELRVEPGELVGIIGPNGAGKTTVFNLITGVYHPTEGSITFKDRDITGMAPNVIASAGIARTFQTIRLFKDLSVLDNVRIAQFSQIKYDPWQGLLRTGAFKSEEREVRSRALDLLGIFNLKKYAGMPARSLPYGEQRRLEIARALACNPSLLLLDEPAAGMNPGEISKLMDLIQWVRSQFNLTILLIEHQMKVVMGICERIKVLDFGETIAEGRPSEIQSNPRVLEAYLGKEMVV
ncbi:MAG: ABC transporter ATP-binding protein [Firmicutes bacterium]|nr:ABC transporter ATP-binding protein [Bacillota bacterium]